MTTPSSVPAQGEATEVLRELIAVEALDAQLVSLRHACYTGDGWKAERKRLTTEYLRRKSAAWDRARALVAASPCEAEHTDHPSRHWDRTCPACNASVDYAAAAAQGGQQPDEEITDAMLQAADLAFKARDGHAARVVYAGIYRAMRAVAAPAAPLTDAEIDACTDRQWGKGCVLSQYMAHRAAAREVQRACAAKWGITLAGTAQKESE